MAQCVGESGSVLAVEAHPKLARALVKRAKKRRLPQVDIIACALHDRIARVPFHCLARHTAYSGVAARRFDFADKVRLIEVDATTIDLLVSARRPGRLAFVKLDLEGGELRALEGGRAVLAHHRPLIVFENDQENSARDYGYSKEDWFGFFASVNYNVFTLWGQPYGPADWGRRDIPWYFIAAPADMANIDFVRQRLPLLLKRYSG
jgi:FkbM family methyltransferase